jgi:ketosteroid isomerase-like protein
MRLQWISLFCVGLLSLTVAASTQRMSNAELKKQVADTERAFAATMKARDHAAFTSFLSQDAVFFGEKGQVLRGKQAVATQWKGSYIEPEPPFSWEPDEVEVVGSGTLAYSRGPVYDVKGKLIGRFNSIWRLEAPNTWKIVFDRGEPVCDREKARVE